MIADDAVSERKALLVTRRGSQVCDESGDPDASPKE
jgi:hypothetical protein